MHASDEFDAHVFVFFVWRVPVVGFGEREEVVCRVAWVVRPGGRRRRRRRRRRCHRRDRGLELGVGGLEVGDGGLEPLELGSVFLGAQEELLVLENALLLVGLELGVGGLELLDLGGARRRGVLAHAARQLALGLDGGLGAFSIRQLRLTVAGALCILARGGRAGHEQADHDAHGPHLVPTAAKGRAAQEGGHRGRSDTRIHAGERAGGVRCSAGVRAVGGGCRAASCGCRLIRCAGPPRTPLASSLAAAVRADGARPRGVSISSIWRGVVVVEDMGHCA